MKGTAPRSADPAEDQALSEQLLHSAKDRAKPHRRIRRQRHMGPIAMSRGAYARSLVHAGALPDRLTMTPTVQATLAEDVGLAQILRAPSLVDPSRARPKSPPCARFWTPNHCRGLYCGSILGWLAPNGDFSLNVAIRTLVSMAMDVADLRYRRRYR